MKRRWTDDDGQRRWTIEDDERRLPTTDETRPTNLQHRVTLPGEFNASVSAARAATREASLAVLARQGTDAQQQLRALALAPRHAKKRNRERVAAAQHKTQGRARGRRHLDDTCVAQHKIFDKTFVAVPTPSLVARDAHSRLVGSARLTLLHVPKPTTTDDDAKKKTTTTMTTTAMLTCTNQRAKNRSHFASNLLV